MKVEFTHHAQQMMTERNISTTIIRRVLNYPDNVGKRQDGTVIAQKRIKWHNREVLCRVIYTQSPAQKVRVITTYITTQLKKYATKV